MYFDTTYYIFVCVFIYLLYFCLFLFYPSMTHADIMCCFSFIGMSNVANKKKFKRRRRWRSIMAWRQVPGAIASAIIPWQEVQWGSAVRVDWTQPIFQVLVKGGNHIIPTTWEPEPESSVEIGRVAVRVFGGFDWGERFDWCLKIAPDNFRSFFFGGEEAEEQLLCTTCCTGFTVLVYGFI